MTRVLVYSDLEALSGAAAGHVAAWIAQHAASNGRFALALSGGSTPRRLYERLAEAQRRAEIPWDKVHIFWGDERAVPPDHPDSNYRMAREALLSHVPVLPAHVHRIAAEGSDLNQAADEYEQCLRDYFSLPPGAHGHGGWPRLDLVLLGVGPDGHTASLFPGAPEVDEVERWAVPTAVAPLEPHVRRLTLTLPVLNHAAQVMVLASGGAKAGLVREILGGRAEDRYPAAQVHVHPPAGSTIWMLDEGAAGRLGDLAEVEWSAEAGAQAGGLIRSGSI